MNRTAIRGSILQAIERELCVTSSRADSIIAWGKRYFPSYFELPPGKHHVDLDARLRKWTRQRNVRAAIEGPRGCAKSTLLTFLYPIWVTCMSMDDYLILFSQTYEQAVKYLMNIREEFEGNDKLARDYPHVCGIGSEWRQDGFVTRNGVRIEALGAGQKIRGRRKRSKRPGTLLIDDAEGDEAAYSKKTRDTIRNWATKGVFKAGGPGTNIFIAGTVVHRECLVAHCGRMPGWRTLRYKSFMRWPDRMDMWGEWERMLIGDPSNNEKAERDAREFFKAHEEEMRQGAEVLWPHLEDIYDLMFMRASEGHAAFESEKQNNPIDPSKCEWAADLFDGDDMWFDEWPEDPQIVVMALDPSKGKKDKQGDFQAIVTLAVGQDACLYVDADVSRRPVDAMVERFVEIARENLPHVAVVEDVQFQELLLPEIEEVARREELLVPVEGISTGGINKVARIRRLGPYISRRRIKFRRRSSGASLVRTQTMDFPAGDHDDGPDAMEMAIRKAEQLLAGDGEGVADPR